MYIVCITPERAHSELQEWNIWLSENLGSMNIQDRPPWQDEDYYWWFNGYCYYFTNEQDALAFKMRFGL